MKILILTRSPDDRSWETRPIELGHLPHQGDYIAPDDAEGASWLYVQIVARLPDGHEYAAKIVCQGISQSEIRRMTLADSLQREETPGYRHELLTEKEAADLVKVHPRTVRRLIEKGKLPAANYGMGRKRIYRIDPAALSNVQPVQPPPPREYRRRHQPSSTLGGVKLRG